MSTPIQNNRINELLVGRTGLQAPTPAPSNPAAKAEFSQILENRLKVSGHAQTRFASRNIEFGQAEWDRVLEGVERAAQKGAKESLVLVDDVALLVSVKNRTVITAVDKAHLKENVFTNIDSAVIV
ncbi:MAG TPA: TIGR02530 family flagellar biosynthesis protein [Fimbriimonadaceae bacterium]|nr:TIGR02530 family flagellar biosynthesis protein [Fimbriimonadaceae bacterium]HRJ96108.1 TIGR02530 family flagellar biosynthesis protein [Fimbriimonadaceae bacterium]